MNSASPVSTTPGRERSLGDILGELASQTTTLVRQEGKLASVEFAQKAAFAARQASYVAVGALLGTVALMALLTAAVIGLATLIPLWSAALLVGASVAAVAQAFVMKGMGALKKPDPVPRQTIKSPEENKLWAQQQVR